MALFPDLLSVGLPALLLLSGAGLIIAEAFAPGAHFFVAGVALFVAGIVGFLLPIGGTLGVLILAGVVLAAGGATLYAYQEFDVATGSGVDQTSDSSSLRGNVGRVTEQVTPRSGRVKLQDGGFNPHYQARSVDGDIPEGTEVMVLDPGGGNVLTVEATDEITDDIDRELAKGRVVEGEPEADAGRDVEAETEAEVEGGSDPDASA